MNLYLRLIWLLLRLPFIKKQSNLLAPSSLKMRVCINDLDLNFHVNNGRYLTMMDLGRIHYMAKTTLLKKTLKRKWMPVLGSTKVNFIRPLNAFNKFTMTTQLLYWDEKWVYLEQKIFKKDQLCVTALFKILFISKKGKIASEELLKLFPQTTLKPSLPDYLGAWMESEKVRADPPK
ncbi:MAG: thioesterase family protein [Candidatus Berkiella sp.]